MSAAQGKQQQQRVDTEEVFHKRQDPFVVRFEPKPILRQKSAFEPCKASLYGSLHCCRGCEQAGYETEESWEMKGGKPYAEGSEESNPIFKVGWFA